MIFYSKLAAAVSQIADVIYISPAKLIGRVFITPCVSLNRGFSIPFTSQLSSTKYSSDHSQAYRTMSSPANQRDVEETQGLGTLGSDAVGCQVGC